LAEEKAKEGAVEEAPGKEIGKISHFFGHINVAVIELTSTMKNGDKIRIKGHSTDFEQPVDSMQIDHKGVDTAKKGQSIGMKVSDKCREGDIVYKVE